MGLRKSSNATNTSVNVGSSNTSVLSGSSNRVAVFIRNNSSNDVYLALGETASLNSGILLPANGGTFELDTNKLFTGSINAIASTNSTITVCELKDN